ncbi:MAG: methyl-accepting chemotaxis protein [Sulfuricurvum sp.]|nr:methyl-accepting chemotaxis protein [Sulfuricurvum sp.]MDP2851410.1 methyl-accepting chemotaxis protein [Sulfuricurvum sp.]
MFDIRKKDYLLLKEAIQNCRDFVFETVNETTIEEESSRALINDLLSDLSHFANDYKMVRDANYIQAGMLALTVFRAKTGELTNVSMAECTVNGSTVLKETTIFYNGLMSRLKELFCEIEDGFTRISHNDLRMPFKSDGWEKDIKKLNLHINELQDIIADQYGQQLTNSLSLRRNTFDLSHYSDELSSSSNEQASSLEETAAAIEELTANVSASAAKAQEMTALAQEAKIAAERGNSVARESLNAMSEMVSATEAINQAVEIIGNIAFQTNILSLNAAVEAATAGDAGRGFAVVAQEVRNLANRSAEAAKNIQEVAKTAREKSHGGLETSKNMMDSFLVITQKIAQTDDMVRDVANANREQMAGISQINGAVGQLDQLTQQNAKTAANVSSLSAIVQNLSDQMYSEISQKEFSGKEEILHSATQMQH